jgi:phosphate transport system protein
MTTRVVFVQELEKLNTEATEMGSLACKAIGKAVSAFVTGEESLKAEVKALDEEIYRCDSEIEKLCLDLIALHTPVAGDLRTVSTCLKIITDLNRIGRYARDIVDASHILEEQRHFKRLISIPQMAGLAEGMAKDAVDSFVTRDAEKARGLFERDDEVDGLYESIFREVLTYMMEDPKKVTMGIHYILVARYLERIADHACNIGERIVYMVNGERLDPAEMKRERREGEAGYP